MRPSFITTKGERNRDKGWDTADLMDRFEDIYAGKWVFEGLPEGVPPDYPARMLFRHGRIQVRDTDIGRVLVAVKPAKRNIYGRCESAVPTGLEGYTSGPTDLLKEDDSPVAEFIHPPAEAADRYVRLMDRALAVLDQNVLGLSQPVIVQGTQGGEINALLLESDLQEGGVSIPCLDKVATQAQVLDLNAQDHTQNLIGVFRAMYAEGLTVIGTQGSGSEKASGMTTEETTSVMQQINMHTYSELAVLEDWCRRVNERFGMNMSVSLGAGWTVGPGDDPAQQETDADGEDETGEN